MCIIAFSYKFPESAHLTLWANRDEFKNRESKEAGIWPEGEGIWGGRDLRGGGAWLAVCEDGRFAFITNYRNLYLDPVLNPISRGKLVYDYLVGKDSPEEYGIYLRLNRDKFEGYNLVWGNHRRAFYYNNRLDILEGIQPGVHTLSNGILDEGWPKTLRLKESFLDSLTLSDSKWIEKGIQALSDRKKARPWNLPNTGVGFWKEWGLSSIFIDLPGYGTRSSTMVRISTMDGINSQIPFAPKMLLREKNWDFFGRQVTQTV